MLWYRHRKVPGRQDTILVADSREAHVFKEPRHGKDGPQCRRYGFRCVEWLQLYVRDATVEDMHVSGAPSSKLSRVARTWV